MSVLSAAAPAVAAANAAPDRDVSEATTLNATQKAVLKQINTDASVVAINAVVTRFLAERAAMTRITDRISKAKVDAIEDALVAAGARPSDMDAAARFVVDQFADKAAARARFREIGVFGGERTFYKKLKTQSL